ncbi:MAG: SEC-C domain-containing protein [Bacteroidetes bacterium]|nr:SEC-C domain-containing protein [Bacteroidota bacterium]MBU1679133.1 SEC-C domain-containing protein [Bacteroidota bacterium]
MDYLKYLRNCPCGSQKKFANCCKESDSDEYLKLDSNRPDWRVAVSGQIAEDVPAAFPGGPSHPKGSYFVVTHFTKHPTYGLMGFKTPHTSALCLSSSLKNSINATKAKSELGMHDIISPDGMSKSIDPYYTLFDYYEFSMISINFAFQAIESYCNSILSAFPNNEFTVTRKGNNEVFSKDEVERKCTTEEKLCDIIPALLDVKSPKGTMAWHNFTKLKNYRDSIVHTKSHDMFSHVDDSYTTLFYVLYDQYPLIYPKFAFEIIWYFCLSSNQKFNQPEWAKRFLHYLGFEIEKYY